MCLLTVFPTEFRLLSEDNRYERLFSANSLPECLPLRARRLGRKGSSRRMRGPGSMGRMLRMRWLAVMLRMSFRAEMLCMNSRWRAVRFHM